MIHVVVFSQDNQHTNDAATVLITYSGTIPAMGRTHHRRLSLSQNTEAYWALTAFDIRRSSEPERSILYVAIFPELYPQKIRTSVRNYTES